MSAARIEVWRDASHVDGVAVAPGFVAIARSERLPKVMKTSLSMGAVVLAARGPLGLCGYATIVPSSALLYEQWHDLPDVFELGAIEVARSARRQRVATSLLDALEDAMPLRSLLLMARGFAGHWDFGEAALRPWDYRGMLLRMLRRAGFAREETDDPEVEENPLNFLAVRFGEEMSARAMLAFKERLVMRDPRSGRSQGVA